MEDGLHRLIAEASLVWKWVVDKHSSIFCMSFKHLQFMQNPGAASSWEATEVNSL
jgi:hypothetical protein